MIESSVSTGDSIYSNNPTPVTFKFFNTSDSPVNNVKVSDLLLTYQNNVKSVKPLSNNCTITLAPNSFCEIRAMLTLPSMKTAYSLKSIFTYNQGSQVNLSLDVLGKGVK